METFQLCSLHTPLLSHTPKVMPNNSLQNYLLLKIKIKMETFQLCSLHIPLLSHTPKVMPTTG
jgi:hypothetical protein